MLAAQFGYLNAALPERFPNINQTVLMYVPTKFVLPLLSVLRFSQDGSSSYPTYDIKSFANQLVRNFGKNIVR